MLVLGRVFVGKKCVSELKIVFHVFVAFSFELSKPPKKIKKKIGAFRGSTEVDWILVCHGCSRGTSDWLENHHPMTDPWDDCINVPS